MTEPKVLIWDIEATNLSASFGTILCVGYKWLGKPKVYVPTILDFAKTGNLDDRGLVQEFSRVYTDADYSVAHYGSKYDLPMINTKLLKYGLPPLPPKKLIDTCMVARKELKMHSNRLEALAQYLGTNAQKTPITFDDWLMAAQGNAGAIKKVVLHCKLDVLALEEVFIKMRPMLREEPVRQLFTGDLDGCPSCGSHNSQRRGFHVSHTRRYQRFQCQDCGKWTRARKAEPIMAKTIGGY